MDISGSKSIGNALLGDKYTSASADEKKKSLNEVADQLNRMSGDIVTKEEEKAANRQRMGKEEFLKLFMHQLKNQDPLNPMQNNEFSQQMATFSQLEQQINMNQNLEKMLANQNNQHSLAFQMLGKEVEGSRASFAHSKDKASALNFEIPSQASEVNLEIFNEEGKVIKVLNVGEQKAGRVDTKWDGKDEQGNLAEGGRYYYNIKAKDVAGQPMQVSSSIKGKVTGVQNADGKVYLLVGESKINLNDVSTIREPTLADKNSVNNVNNAPTNVNQNGKNDKDTAGTKSETTQNATDNKNGTSVKVSEEAAEAIKSADASNAAGDADVLNPLIPFLYR